MANRDGQRIGGCLLGFFAVSSALATFWPRPGGLDLAAIAALLAMGGIAMAVVGQPKDLPSPRDLALVFGLLIAALAPVVGAPSTAYGSEKSLALVATLPVALLGPALVLRRPKARRSFFVTVFAVNAVATVATFPAVLSGVPSRVGLGGEENIIGAGRAAGIALLGAVALAVLPVGRRRMRAAGALFLAFISVPVIAASASRGPMLATSAAVLVFLLLQARPMPGKPAPRKSVIVGSVIAVALGSAASVYMLEVEWSGRLTRHLAADVSRLTYFRTAWEAGLQAPLGNGWATFPEAIGFAGIAYPHNIFLEFWAEAGAVATTIFVALVALGLRRAIQVRSFEGSLLFALLVGALVNASVSSDLVGNRLTLVLLALATILPPSVESLVRSQQPSSRRFDRKPPLGSRQN